MIYRVLCVLLMYFILSGQIVFSQKKIYGVISKECKLLFPLEYTSIKPFKDDRFVIKKDGLCTLVNSAGAKIIQESYSDIEYFSDKFILVWNSEKCGLVDFSGKLIIPLEFNTIKFDDDGYIVVRKDISEYKSNYGLYNSQGLKLFDCLYSGYRLLPNGNTLVSMRSNEAGAEDNSLLYNNTGVLVKTFEKCMFSFRDSWPYFVIIKERMGPQIGAFYDFNGNEIRPFEMNKFWYLKVGAQYCKGDVFYYLNDDLKDVCSFDGYRISEIKDDYILLKHLKKDKYGYANAKGEIIVPVKYEYDKLPPIPKDDFPVKAKPVVKKVFVPSEQKSTYKETRTLVNKNNKVGVADAEGKELIKCEYNYIEIQPDYYIVGNDIPDEISSENDNTFCYTAIVQKSSSTLGSTSKHVSAIFVEINVIGSKSESEIMGFGRQKASAILNGYSISTELLDKNYNCRKCKENAMKMMTLDDFQILYETLK